MRSRREASNSRYTPQHIATFSCSAAIFSEFTTLPMMLLKILTGKRGGEKRKHVVCVWGGGLRVVPLLLRHFTLAVHCNALQRTAALCNTRQHSATLCTALPRAAVHCNTLQHTATYATKWSARASAMSLPRHIPPRMCRRKKELKKE